MADLPLDTPYRPGKDAAILVSVALVAASMGSRTPLSDARSVSRQFGDHPIDNESIVAAVDLLRAAIDLRQRPTPDLEELT